MIVQLTLSTILLRNSKSLLEEPVDFLRFRKTRGDNGSLAIVKPGISDNPALQTSLNFQELER